MEIEHFKIGRKPKDSFEKAILILEKELPNSEITEYTQDRSKCVLLINNPDESDKVESKELIEQLSPCLIAWEFDKGYQYVPHPTDLHGRIKRKERNYEDYLTLYFKK